MKSLLATGLILLSAHASAAISTKVKRGDLEIRVKVTGTVIADDIFRIKSSIEGRVESVLTSTYVWRGTDQPLAFLAHKELAAMLDSRGSQNVNILEDRWQRVFRPAAARCPDTCFILKNFLKTKTWIKPESVMFEAAATLRLVGRVRPEDAAWIRDDQELVFWPVMDPKRILKGRVTKFLFDIQGEKVIPGATFTWILSPDRFFAPGTEWEGYIITLSKKDVLYVPTDALIRDGDDVYLPVRVSTGITTQSLTEIPSGIDEGRAILVLDDAQLRGSTRHKKQEADLEALKRRVRNQQREEVSGPEIGTDYGEDPYAEPQ